MMPAAAAASSVLSLASSFLQGSFSPVDVDKFADLFRKSIEKIDPKKNDPEACKAFCSWLVSLTEQDIDDLKGILNKRKDLLQLFQAKVDTLTFYFNDEYEAAKAAFECYQHIEVSKITMAPNNDPQTMRLLDCKAFAAHIRKTANTLVYLSRLSAIFCERTSKHFLQLRTHFRELNIFRSILIRAFDINKVTSEDLIDTEQVYEYFGMMGLRYLDDWFEFLKGHYTITYKGDSGKSTMQIYGLFLEEIQLTTLEDLIRQKIYNRELLFEYLKRYFSKNWNFKNFTVEDLNQPFLSQIYNKLTMFVLE